MRKANNAVVLFYRYDSRVKAMEVDERPTEQYSDIGGLDKQIQEVGKPTLTKKEKNIILGEQP